MKSDGSTQTAEATKSVNAADLPVISATVQRKRSRLVSAAMQLQMQIIESNDEAVLLLSVAKFLPNL